MTKLGLSLGPVAHLRLNCELRRCVSRSRRLLLGLESFSDFRTSLLGPINGGGVKRISVGSGPPFEVPRFLREVLLPGSAKLRSV